MGLGLGIGSGLYIGWGVSPTRLTDVAPVALSETAQQDYLRLIAAAYWQDDNLAVARQRLASLGRVDLNDWVLATSVNAILQDDDVLAIRQLVYLAMSLGLESAAFLPYLPAKLPIEGTSNGG